MLDNQASALAYHRAWDPSSMFLFVIPCFCESNAPMEAMSSSELLRGMSLLELTPEAPLKMKNEVYKSTWELVKQIRAVVQLWKDPSVLNQVLCELVRTRIKHREARPVQWVPSGRAPTSMTEIISLKRLLTAKQWALNCDVAVGWEFRLMCFIVAA